MCTERSLWERAVEFHGHSCPGLAIGYRVAEIAMQRLHETRSADEELVAVVENDACGVDAVMVLTGCTLGKGNLIYRDLGKQVYTFGSRSGGKALRIAVKSTGPPDPEVAALRRKVSAKTAGPAEQAKFHLLQGRRIEDILHMPADDFCSVREVDFNLPSKARLFPSLECSRCGEKVMEPRARLLDGAVVCLDCFDDYSRGW